MKNVWMSNEPVSNWKIALYVCRYKTRHYFTFSNLARFSAMQTRQHWTALKCVMHYLKDTINFGIQCCNHNLMQCTGYSDADWAVDFDKRRSMTGYLFQISGGAATWKERNSHVLHCPLQK